MNLHFLRVLSSAFAANPAGSKNPTGGRAPGMLSTVNAFRALEVRAAGAGAKAAAEPRRREAMARFIIIVVMVVKGSV